MTLLQTFEKLATKQYAADREHGQEPMADLRSWYRDGAGGHVENELIIDGQIITGHVHGYRIRGRRKADGLKVREVPLPTTTPVMLGAPMNVKT